MVLHRCSHSFVLTLGRLFATAWAFLLCFTLAPGPCAHLRCFFRAPLGLMGPSGVSIPRRYWAVPCGHNTMGEPLVHLAHLQGSLRWEQFTTVGAKAEMHSECSMNPAGGRQSWEGRWGHSFGFTDTLPPARTLTCSGCVHDTSARSCGHWHPQPWSQTQVSVKLESTEMLKFEKV